MGIRFTDEQRAAIDSRGNRLIVSAAAGSGKTAVLVRRVIELLCEPGSDRRISDFVVVTFTNAAASEMRSRIGAAIHERLAAEPNNSRLRRQLALLPTARIQTVHSFCQELIRQNFTRCGVTADFKLMDEEESLRLRDEVLDGMLEAEYSADLPQFRQLCDAMRENRGDARLVKVITNVYEKVLSFPEPERWLQQVREQSSQYRPEDTMWGKHTLQLVGEQLRRLFLDLDAVWKLLRNDITNIEVYRTYFEMITEQLEPLRDPETKTWDQLFEAVSRVEWARMPQKKIDAGVKEQLKLLREDMKKRISRIRENLLVADSGTIEVEQRQQAGLVQEVCRLTEQLLEMVRRTKRERNQLDFSDLEHLAYRLLTDADGGPSDLARELSGQIKELLVDEYQDTNALQDAIFERIAPSRGGVFLVGDLKQSIYRFRMAEPSIFLEKYKESQPLQAGATGQKARLALNKNFRSSKQVVELCNFVFERVMSEAFGGIDYDDSERLNAESVKPEGEMTCEAWLLEKAPRGEESEKSAETEARFVAARISQMLRETTVDNGNGGRRPARPGDFAVLLSSFSNKEPYYSAELQKLQIPVAAASRGDFWNSPEILTVLSFLRVIDNRRQDIPMIGLMRSPVYLFTADELARIRLRRRLADYIDAVELAAPDMPKAAALLQDLDRYADLACDMSVSQLMRLIYEEKNIPAVFAAMENGGRRRENLELLLNMAVRYERSASRGLYRFLQYVDRMILQDRQPEAAGTGDGVQLMSIHKSKGLEFPIVFMPDLDKSFNEADVREPVLVHKDNGIAMKLRFPQLHAEITTQTYASTARRIQSESRAEELRKLYVGMTRAKERLVLSAAVSKPGDFLAKMADEFGMGQYDPLAVGECGKMSDWVFGTLLQHPGGEVFRQACGRLVRTAPGPADGLSCRMLSWGEELPAYVYTEQQDMLRQQTGPQNPRALLEMMDMEYPYAAVSELPSKLTPTGIKRLMPETAELYAGPHGTAIRLYHAAAGDRGGAAERGKANHLALSVLPLERCSTPDSLARELELARAEGRIPEATLALVDPKLVLQFTAGPLGARTLAADRYLREYEFGVLLPPEKLLGGPETGEQILINGVIDLLLFEGDSMTVIDFKTDSVKPGAAREAAAKHKLQLEIYAQAAAEIFGLPVRQRIVFFLRTGEWAEV